MTASLANAVADRSASPPVPPGAPHGPNPGPSKPLMHSLKPTDSLDSAARLFTTYGQRTIPVVEGDKLMGVITITDLIRTYGKLVGESGI